MRYSSKWKMWKAILDFKICLNCRKNHGKIYEINEFVYPEPPLHPNCRCEIESLRISREQKEYLRTLKKAN